MQDMEAKQIRYPIGIQTFSDIIEGEYFYIDKTGYVHELADKYRYVFLSRPRRFGKSLLSSTFHSYFAGESKLFAGLRAGGLRTDWPKHPVFHFDMSTAKHTSRSELLSELDLKLSRYEAVYGRGEGEIEVNQRLEGLVRRSVEQTGEKAVIIIDEYDAPLLDVMGDRERLAPMRQIMRNFYSPIKSLDPYLRFVFITGINKFAQLSIFSELNNLMNISMMPQYSAVCGISQAELETQMQEPVRTMAAKLGMSCEQTLQELKRNYDGYHFCAQSEDIYNPFSLIKALDACDFRSYWFDTGTPTHLLERLRCSDIDETALDNMPMVPESDFDISPEISDNVLPVLYQTGYLTIKDYDRELQLYTLGYPNREVKIGFTQGLLSQYRSRQMTGGGFVAKFYASMYHRDLDSALSLMRSFLAGIPYDLENKTEKHFQTIIYLIFSLLGYYTRAEVKSAAGRADAVCWTRDRIYVFEFKVDGSAGDALSQIDDKGYLIPYAAESTGSALQLVKVGVNISTATRTLDDWKIDIS